MSARRTLLALCFASSAAELVLEIAWGRALGLVLGVTVLAVTAVLAAFMLGLALGGAAARRFAAWAPSPVVLYARLHAGAGIAAAATLAGLPLARAAYVAGSRALGQDTGSHFLLFTLAFGLLAVPATLLGATFPVAAQILAPEPSNVGRDVGALYSAGTLGGFVGIVIAATVLLPFVGLHGTVLVASGIELAVAVLAAKLTSPPFEVPSAAAKLPVLVVAAAAWLGAQTLAYEVLWTRVLTYFVDTSLYSFALMLGVFLGGLAAGGALGARYLGARSNPGVVFACLQIALGLASIAAIPALAHVGPLLAAVDTRAGWSWTLEAGARFVVLGLTLFVPTASMGAAFPVLASLGAARAPIELTVRRIYAANSAGGVVGSLVAGVVLAPRLGVQGSVLLLGSLGAASGVAVVLASAASRTVKGSGLVATAAALAIAVHTVPSTALYAVFTDRYPAPENELLYLRESESGTVAVFRDAQRGVPVSRRHLVIDGRGEVSTDYFSMRAFRFLGVLPALYARSLDRALVVTFGSGIVSGTIAGLPDVKHADSVEICPDAFEAARFFSDENHDVLHDPKLTRIVDDGRNFLLTTQNRYDLLSADATHPASRESWILYTREFYALAASRLNDGGVMSQWIPMHGVSEADFKTLLATFHSVFPFVAVYYTGGFKGIGHVVFVGSKQPLRIDVHHAERLFQDERLAADLARVNVTSLPDLFAAFLFDETAIDGFTNGAPLNTDDLPRVSFSLPEAAPVPRSWLASLVRARSSVFPELSGMDAEMATAVKAGLVDSFDASGISLEGQVREAEEYAERATLDLDHPGPDARVRLERSLAALNDVVATYRRALQRSPGDTQTRYLLARASAEARSLQGVLGSDLGGMRSAR